MTTAPPDTAQDALTAARRLAPELSRRAREAERLRTMPPDLVGGIRRAGLFRLALPRSLGGLELPPAAIVETVEELCRADGSAGWTTTIGNVTAALAWLDPAVARELLARELPEGVGDPVCSAVFAPTGRLAPAGDDRFRLSGRWGFSTGSAHADLFVAGALVHDGGSPRILPGVGPDWRLSVLPVSAVTVVDTWDAVGLRGTGSHDVVIDSTCVPVEHTMAPFREPARHDGPSWRLPFATFVSVLLAGVPLGIARRALDELTRFAPTKIRLPGSGPIAEDGDLQLALTRAEGGLQSARAFVMDALGGLWDSACAGDVPPDATRARFLLANQQAMRASVQAVDSAFALVGMAAQHADHPLQRCFRDIHAVAAHIQFSATASKRYARTRLGLEQPTFWF